MKTAFITGIAGQDGSYLAELLCKRGYRVVGLVRRGSRSLRRNRAYLKGCTLVYGDVTERAVLRNIFRRYHPDVVYHLASVSFMPDSWENEELSYQVITIGTLHLLNCFREFTPNGKFFFAGSSEMFGSTKPPQRETSRFRPNNPYGIAKVAAYHICESYRQNYGLFIATGILFSHESPRKDERFVIRKIIKTALQIAAGKVGELKLGNVVVCRDWGYAPEYAEAMHRILQLPKPDTFVIGTGTWHSVRELLEYVFRKLALDPAEHITFDRELVRRERNRYRADNRKIRAATGWKPQTTFPRFVDRMLEAEKTINNKKHRR